MSDQQNKNDNAKDHDKTDPNKAASADNGDSQKKAAKKPKRQGPIRFEAIIPFAIVVAIVWAYFFFFFDSHLRRGMEYVGTQANGAEVNIGSLKTSFWSASLKITQIQVTDAEAPTKNKVQIGEVRWSMLWDALLRGKVAIQEASILEVAIGAPRARPGRVLPPPPPNERSAFDKVRDQALAKAKDEFSQNVLGDIAAVLGGADPAAQLKNIEAELKSSIRIKELQTEFAKKEQEWKERLAALPQAKDFKEIETRIKAVKLDRFNNPQELQTSLQQLDSIKKEIDTKINSVQSTGKAVGTDSKAFQTSLQDLEGMVRQDIKDLESRLNIPKLDVGSLSKSIFGPMFLGRVKQVEGYMDKAREYMPPPKTPEEKAMYAKPKPRERVVGRNYKFGRPNSYPLFWLKRAEISSKSVAGADWSGDLSGTLQDVTDDPPVLGRPTVASFKGDFPKQEIFGINGKITIDHVTNEAVETLDLKVDRFAMLERILIDSPEVKLGFGKADVTTNFAAELKNRQVKITSRTVFKRAKTTEGNGTVAEGSGDSSAQGETATPDSSSASQGAAAGAGSFAASKGAGPIGFLNAQATQPLLAEVLTGALNDIPQVTLNAGVSGEWSNLKFDFDSNLGTDLARAFDKQVQLKINEARQKLQAFVDERVGQEKEKLTAEFNKAKSQLDNLVKEKEAEIKKFQAQIEKAKNDAVKAQSKRLENEGKKAVEDLLKNKLKF